MEAHASIINNNLNIMMKNMSAIALAVAIPTFFTGVFGMSEFTEMIKGNIKYWYISYPAFALSMFLISFVIYRLIKKWDKH